MSSSWSLKGWFSSLSSASSSLLSSSSSLSSLRQFSSAEIRKATNNFDNSQLLWQGWAIKVYKGTYHDDNDGTEKTVTIKCLQQSIENFKEQLYVSSQYCHKHVVKAVGYCHEPPDRNIIVYEYMSNGSLANLLCTKITSTSFCLSSEQCLEICIDAARGLEYLHTHIRSSNGNVFFHYDVTPSSIMLDGNGVAKISDLYYEWNGYYEPASHFAPEYHSGGRVNQKSDVYAFGVLLVKLLSRKVCFDREDRYIGKWIKKCITNGTINELLHPEMKAQISGDRLKALLRIAGECLDNDFMKRPSFSQVVKKLELLMVSKVSSRRLCPCYPFQEIEDVTNNFDRIIGQGGEGKVYKGLTKTNIPVAVKCLKPEHSSEFAKEIKMLSDLDHPNLVSLVGYCHGSDDHQNILMYEFMCKGNLAQHLYGRSTCILSWNQRLNICIGAARGLSYLHTPTGSLSKGIIHRDVKPTNILLDENFNAKISDFGLSKMSRQAQSNSMITTMLKGTTGYYAPEYQRLGQITRKIDVYAFGVVLSEVLCRKKPWDREESFYPTEDEKYGQWAKQNIDPDLKGAIAPVCLEAFTDTLEKCLNWNPKRRPSMMNVVSVLEYALKWQEAWQRHKFEGGEDSVVLYYSSTSQQGTSMLGLRLLLRGFLEQIDERDTAKDLYAMELKQVLGNTIDIHMAHVFVRGNYVGDVNDMKKLYMYGDLAKFCGSPHYKFFCDSCGEAVSCGDCKKTVWYVHCKECGALIVVRGQCQSKLRNCLECHGSQLINGSYTERRRGQIRQYLAKGADFVISMFQ